MLGERRREAGLNKVLRERLPGSEHGWKNVQGRESNRCAGPEAGVCVVCLRTNEEASVAAGE